MAIRIFGIAGSTNAAEDFRLAACGIFVPASALNNRTGVLTTPVLTGTGNFTATVSPFTCLIDGTSNSLQGSYWVTLDIATTITITAANTQPRIDLVSMQIQDNAYDGSGFQRGQLVVTAGTPAGSPVAPATPANAIALWTVPVAANATSVVFSSTTAVFPYTAATGGIVPVRTAADQPAVADAVQYRHRLDVPAGGVSPLEWSMNGTTWNPVIDVTAASPWSAWTNLTAAGSYTNSTQPRYRTAPGGLVQLSGSVQYTGATGAVSASTIFSAQLPSCTGNKATMPLVQVSATMYPAYLVASSTNLGLTAANIANNAFVNFDGLLYATN